jgi:hypothetical protein
MTEIAKSLEKLFSEAWPRRKEAQNRLERGFTVVREGGIK